MKFRIVYEEPKGHVDTFDPQELRPIIDDHVLSIIREDQELVTRAEIAGRCFCICGEEIHEGSCGGPSLWKGSEEAPTAYLLDEGEGLKA